MSVAALALLGVGGYVLSQPRKGSVEYHKKEFLRARDGSSIGNMVRSISGRIGRPVVETGKEVQERNKRANRHYAALMRLGYICERVFVVSNPVENVAEALWFTVPKSFTNEVGPLGQIGDAGTNTITVVAPAEEMAQWERAIRTADIPKP